MFQCWVCAQNAWDVFLLSNHCSFFKVLLFPNTDRTLALFSAGLSRSHDMMPELNAQCYAKSWNTFAYKDILALIFWIFPIEPSKSCRKYNKKPTQYEVVYRLSNFAVALNCSCSCNGCTVDLCCSSSFLPAWQLIRYVSRALVLRSRQPKKRGQQPAILRSRQPRRRDNSQQH